MKYWGAFLFLLCVSAQAQVYVPPSDTSILVTQSQLSALGYITAAQAPVQSVNTKTGNPIIPTLCRQQSPALSIPSTNPGSVTYTFPNTVCNFASTPSCWADISTSNSSFVFDFPLNIARSTTAVSYSFTAHANILTIALGSLSLTLAPPAGSTVVLTCTGAPL